MIWNTRSMNGPKTSLLRRLSIGPSARSFSSFRSPISVAVFGCRSPRVIDVREHQEQVREERLPDPFAHLRLLRLEAREIRLRFEERPHADFASTIVEGDAARELRDRRLLSSADGATSGGRTCLSMPSSARFSENCSWLMSPSELPCPGTSVAYTSSAVHSQRPTKTGNSS
jgi:hypothetical protein